MKYVLLFILFWPTFSFSAPAPFVPGEFVVRLKKNVSVQTASWPRLSQSLGATVTDIIPEQNIVVIQRASFEDPQVALKLLAENKLVEIAEPNFIYQAHRTPNDPMFLQQWGLYNYGQTDADLTSGIRGMDIGALKAWDITTGSKNMIVAVVDSGIDYYHPDLQGNLWTNQKELSGKEGVDDDQNGIVDDIFGANFVDSARPTGDPMDDYGHGTHVSGTIGAQSFNGQGVSGTAWHVKLLPVKFLNENGTGQLTSAIKAIHYARSMGAKIYSNSWGGGGYSENLKQAIEMTSQTGGVFVASAGNDSSNNDEIPEYPASYPVANVIAVGSMNNRGRLSDFSNYGRYSVDVAAPGENILSTDLYGGYTILSGTSMAVPHISGIAVLLWSKNPELKNTTIRSRIMSTTKNLLGGARIRRGLAYAPAALQNAITNPDPDDPRSWKQLAVKISTTHPYLNNASQEFVVYIPGAKRIALYFAKFKTEVDLDKVELLNRRGERVYEVFGKHDGEYSLPVDGDYVKIVFTSDGSVTDYGFDVTRAAWE